MNIEQTAAWADAHNQFILDALNANSDSECADVAADNAAFDAKQESVIELDWRTAFEDCDDDGSGDYQSEYEAQAWRY
jgi:hypothetical protein